MINSPNSNLDNWEEKQKVEISKSSKDDKDHSNGENGQYNISPVLEENEEDTEMSEPRAERVENVKDCESNSLKQSSGLGVGVCKEDVKDGETSAPSKDVDMVTSSSTLESTDPPPHNTNFAGEISREESKGCGNDMECDLTTDVDKSKEPIASNENKQPEKFVASESSLLLDKPKNVPDSLVIEKSDLQQPPAVNEGSMSLFSLYVVRARRTVCVTCGSGLNEESAACT